MSASRKSGPQAIHHARLAQQFAKERRELMQA